MLHFDPHPAFQSSPIPGAALSRRLSDGWRDLGDEECWIEIAELSAAEVPSVFSCSDESCDAIPPGWRLVPSPEFSGSSWRGSLLVRANGPGHEVTGYLTVGTEISPNDASLLVSFEIEAIFVDADHRGLGHARALVDAAAEGAEAELLGATDGGSGTVDMILKARVRHPAARHLVEEFCERVEAFARRHAGKNCRIFRDIS